MNKICNTINYKINLDLDIYFNNPYTYIPTLVTSKIDNTLEEIIYSILRINNKNKKIEDDKNKIFNPIIFKYIANNNLLKLEQILKTNNKFINQQDKDGDSPLHIAVFLCNTAIIKILIKYKADLYIKDKWGQLPLHRLCFCFDKKNSYDLLNLFITELKDQKKNYFNIQDNFGNTILHLLLKNIIKNKTNINQFYISIIKILKSLTNNNLKNIDNQSIKSLLKLINI